MADFNERKYHNPAITKFRLVMIPIIQKIPVKRVRRISETEKYIPSKTTKLSDLPTELHERIFSQATVSDIAATTISREFARTGREILGKRLNLDMEITDALELDDAIILKQILVKFLTSKAELWKEFELALENFPNSERCIMFLMDAISEVESQDIQEIEDTLEIIDKLVDTIMKYDKSEKMFSYSYLMKTEISTNEEAQIINFTARYKNGKEVLEKMLENNIITRHNILESLFIHNSALEARVKIELLKNVSLDEINKFGIIKRYDCENYWPIIDWNISPTEFYDFLVSLESPISLHKTPVLILSAIRNYKRVTGNVVLFDTWTENLIRKIFFKVQEKKYLTLFDLDETEKKLIKILSELVISEIQEDTLKKHFPTFYLKLKKYFPNILL